MLRSEPMWLGSPSSPTSPPAQRQQTPYLPPYLMGESSFSASVTPSAKPWSKTASPVTVRSPLKCTPSGRSGYLNARTSFYEKEAENRPMRRRHGPPPVKTLDESFSTSINNASRLDDVDGLDVAENSLCQLSTSGYLQRQPPTTGRGGYENLNASRDLTSGARPNYLFNNSQVMSPSPAQLDPFYTQGESLNIGDDLDETWVTVFGFHQSSASFILQEFASFGTIVNHVTPSEGNWIHLRFQNKLQAKRAISKSGKVFGGKIMVGVTQCIDKSVMNSKRSGLRSSASYGNLTNLSQADNLLSPDSSMSRKTMRPLTAAYKVATNDHLVSGPTAVPEKSTGFISKAMEYMLGW